jgi:transposase
MSLRAAAMLPPIPSETIRVARAAFPRGSLALRLRDEFGDLYKDARFAPLFARLGQPAVAPWRLMLVTLLQFAGNLTDRQAAEAVRSRLDWKYALSLDLEDPGFDFSVLSEFRARLLDLDGGHPLLDSLLEVLTGRGLLTPALQRTDATHVLGAIRKVNRLELVGETLRCALNSLAEVAPDWLATFLAPDGPQWIERYQHRFADFRLPRGQQARAALAEQIGADGQLLLRAVGLPEAPAWLRTVPAVECLRRVWVQQYYAAAAGTVRWRTAQDQPPAGQLIHSPYDPEARYGTKRQEQWVGYKVHLTETCAPDAPHVVVHVATTPAAAHDASVVPDLHRALAAGDRLPREHLVDQGYLDAALVVASQAEHGVTLVGPLPGDQSRQSAAAQGFALPDFTVEWEARRVQCPRGQRSATWVPSHDQHGAPVTHVSFARAVCEACPVRAQCTRATSSGRKLTLRPRAEHEVLMAARRHQRTAAFQARYARRAGVEGTLAQGTRVFGLRQARYRGLAKTHLQHVLTAIAMNLVRVLSWLIEPSHSQTPVSRFVALAATG